MRALRLHNAAVAFVAWMGVISLAGAADEEPPKAVPVAEAAKHVNQQVAVELTVQSSRLLAERNTCFLNSEKDFRSEQNFTVVIQRMGLEKFKEAKIADPAAHFQGKKIRATGKITLRNEKPQLIVTEIKQIELLTDAAKSDSGKSG